MGFSSKVTGGSFAGPLPANRQSLVMNSEHKLKVLVVDDNEASRYTVCSPLRNAGYEVAEASTGAEGLAALSRLGADLVVLDAKLPDESGLEICRKLKANPLTADVPILQVSASTRTDDRVKALEGGADVFLILPFDPSELLAQVKALLRVRAAERGREQAQRALRESEARYRLLFDRNPDGVFAVDPDGRFTMANPACETLSGYPLQELLQKTFMDLCAPDQLERTTATFQRNIEDPGFHQLQTAFVRKDGRRVEVWVSSEVIVRDGKRVAVHCTAKDITERKAFEAELERKVAERTRELRDTNEHLNAFCYSVAHDLKAPLRAQVGFAKLLLDQFGHALGERGCDYARRIAAAGERQSQLLDDLLAHVSLSRTELPLAPVDLAAILDQARTDLAAEIQHKSAQLQVAQLNTAVLANTASLQLVVTHLLSNALKFVAPGINPTVRIWSERLAFSPSNPKPLTPSQLSLVPVTSSLNSQPSTHLVRLWVQDNGIGIPPEQHHRIFGVFQRLHTHQQYPGTGIGLAIVKRAIERMGGRAGVESAVGKGSRFWIELGAAAPVPNQPAACDAPAPLSPAPL